MTYKVTFIAKNWHMTTTVDVPENASHGTIISRAAGMFTVWIGYDPTKARLVDIKVERCATAGKSNAWRDYDPATGRPVLMDV